MERFSWTSMNAAADTRTFEKMAREIERPVDAQTAWLRREIAENGCAPESMRDAWRRDGRDPRSIERLMRDGLSLSAALSRTPPTRPLIPDALDIEGPNGERIYVHVVRSIPRGVIVSHVGVESEVIGGRGRGRLAGWRVVK